MNDLNKGFSWDVATDTLATTSGIILPGHKAIIRSDNNAILHVAKKGYTPTSNQRLVQLVDKLAAITGLKPAGFSEFGGGRLVLGYLENPNKTQVLDWDTKNYMVVGNGHDGTKAAFVGSSDIMIRCTNAFSHINQKFKAYHSSKNEMRLQEIEKYFTTYMQEKNLVVEKMEQFHKVKISKKIIAALADRLFKVEAGKEDALGTKKELSTRKANIVASFMECVDIETADLGTNAFGLFNAVTRFTTHHQKAKEKVFGNVFGLSATYNNKAFEYCNALVK